MGMCILWLLSVPWGSFGSGRLMPAFAIIQLPPFFVEYVISIPYKRISILAFEGKYGIFLVLGKLREYIQDLKRKILINENCNIKTWKG